jgi:signal transduction histidine kinase
MPSTGELAAIAAHLAQRRPAILEAWRAAVTSDPTLTTGSSLPRAQLHDHLPALLADFERRLLSLADAEGADLQGGLQGDAAAHGLHRWQQGFDVAEVTRELAQFNECVVVEIDAYEQARPNLGRTLMPLVRLAWARHHGAAVSASTLRYFQLQQLEARSHIQDLEAALDALRQLEQQHAQLWQQAAHDLRGNVGVVANVAAGLTSAQASAQARDSFVRLLDRNVHALRDLLNDVTGLARLQSGQERRLVKPLDAAVLLRDLCDGLRPAARERGLSLHVDGPAPLLVESDGVKIRRVTQNLVLNAIRYTRQGTVSVAWGPGDGKDPDRWFIEVQDTGPGFHAGPGSPLAGALEAASEQATQVAADAIQGVVSHADGDPAADRSRQPRDPHPVQQGPGEGIGLSIVKRLCELLDATLSVQSTIGVGTRFRIHLPRRYTAP